MRASKRGRLGVAVYAMNRKDLCKTIARNRYTKPPRDRPIVVILEVDLGRLKNMWDKDEGTENPCTDLPWWTGGAYDTGYAKHPPWPGGGADNGLREFVIPDPSRCKVIDVEEA